MSIEWITLLMFGSLLLVLILGMPVAFACGSIGMIFTITLLGPSGASLGIVRTFTLMNNYLLAAIPLFIFMAAILERSGIMEELYEVIYRWMGGIRGGVASATVVACTILAAMVGVIGASETTMSMIALPEMFKRGYNKRLAMGAVLAGGTLGILIPPSVLMIVYGLVANESIGQLYAGSFLPGFLLSGLYIAYITIRCWIRPKMGPAVPLEERISFVQKLMIARGIVVPMILVALVLGIMFAGIASPTEAAGVGAFGSIVIVTLQRKFSWAKLYQACENTLKATSMVLWTIFGANLFVALYVAVGGANFVEDSLLGSGLGRWGVLLFMQVILLFLGCFLDWVGILMLCVPIFVPIIKKLGFDPIWFGVLYSVNMQISFLSPPFGYALFYLAGAVGPRLGITTREIWWSAIPFIALQVVGLALCIIFPQIILWAPQMLYK
ncbi:MAG TPA: TRAP transporter large permease subunit [Phototrophicaceae bacterium]|nr:TRAP transporter large permease subunit [Phototrophicaceae bacterium]